MAACPDKNTRRLRTRILSVLCFFTAAIVLGSCNSGNILVITDPYIDSVAGRHWKPAGRLFQIQAGFKGYRVISVETSQELDINRILEIDAGNSDILIASPYTFRELPSNAGDNRRIIVAGGSSTEAENDAEFVYPDRMTAFRSAGELAAGETGSVYALFNSSTEARRLESVSFVNGFLESSGDIARLTVYDMAEIRSTNLPDDFEERISAAETLVMLGGIFNLPGILASSESAPSIIGEYLDSSGIEEQRILASVEDNPRAMVKALLQQIVEPDISGEKSYNLKLVIK